MKIYEIRFTFYALAVVLLLCMMWGFAVWLGTFFTAYAVMGGALLIPLFGAVAKMVPEEKRNICTQKDLKILNNIARTAFAVMVVLAVAMLVKVPASPAVQNCLGITASNVFIFIMCWGIAEFILHLFALLMFYFIAWQAPKDQRKKPMLLANGIFLCSTFLQISVMAAIAAMAA